ncbi:replication initiation protein [Clostridium perfringens]|uniref:Replication initiation protein n=1 Tax=Clostridium perfringens TaxID=1502 RepID=A0A2X2Y7Z7_CLOPF|nr:replisome organizer [Clostridium perfringens]SQB60284.1 replication initiation protein [Clostridium perfringens]
MAQRRMFSIKIIDSAKFLKMPSSTRLLYYDLGMRADDDGIVEAFNVLRMTGATEDDLRVLASKGYIKVLNEDLVTYIFDWQEHNKIRADRKIDSLYKDLLLQIIPEVKLVERKQRADRKAKLLNESGTSQRQPKDCLGQDRLGQDRLGQDRTTTVEIEEVLKNFNTEEIESISKFCSKNNISVDVVVEKFNIIKNLKKIDNRVGALITAIKEDWKPNKGQVNNNCNFSQRDYDYDSLEKQLLGWEE